MSRREFTRNQKEQIVERSKVDGVVRCERCYLALVAGEWEIDHIIPEANRPEADKKSKITIAEGQLLGKCCHRGADGKTNQDVKDIAKGKRQYNAAHGLKRKAPPIHSAPFEHKPKNTDKLPVPGPKQLFQPERQP